MILTHCDYERPTDQFIADKIASFKECGEFEIPRDHVVLFDKTPASLLPNFQKLSPGNMQFVENLPEKVKKIFKELPGDFKKLDKE